MNRCLVGLVFASSAFVGAAQVPATVIAAGYSASTPIKVAPGQVLTVFVHGIGSKLSAPVNADTVPLPTSLAGISAKLVQFNPEQAVPILAVEPIVTCSDALKQFGPGCGSYTAVTLQIPFEMQAEDPTRLRGAPVGGAVLRFSEDGEIAATVGLVPIVDQVHLLRSCDVILSKLAGTGAGDFACKPIAAHADGELVSELNPAQAGEEIVLYGVGFGQTSPQMATGHPAASPAPTAISFRVGFDPRPNALASRPSRPADGTKPGAAPVFVGSTAGFVGLYQLNVVVPALPLGARPCTGDPGDRIDSNMTINIGGPGSFDGVGICVAPSA